MKRAMRFSSVSALAALALLFAVMGPRDAVAQDQKGPRIAIAEERFDFGKAAAGETAVHIFEITNTGDALLEINKVQTS
jgi:hypothetical protein